MDFIIMMYFPVKPGISVEVVKSCDYDAVGVNCPNAVYKICNHMIIRSNYHRRGIVYSYLKC